ncbi:hypothetical protein Fleli_1245 [Bernardetia litoralis DSM 6794]|uniref:Uncharacterized protein n=1 Tax=Bernardetia litoralis (strain ATCC 23117 / DSM 6794 / NBRC 15988 / NCIMB 1366 / Fx l1 / Sio-4) TaxID=880071 RepID=I4AI96_BERLS|nr:hypothetical protein [Bernardetia litoralis]AFM03681.1 hypothetical protein Fleli_1245 [Bernardetia litoralis DSM 6794]
MKNLLTDIEKKIDKKVAELKIWELSFQSIYYTLLFMAEKIDKENDKDTAMDYLSRMSLIYPLIKKYAKGTKTKHLLKVVNEYSEDINFLNAYAHFSVIMPQVHRDTLKVKSVNEKHIILDFANIFVKECEIIDKLYSVVSIPISFSYKDIHLIKTYTNSKAKNRVFQLTKLDFEQINKIYNFHLETQINIEVLSDNVVESHIGFSYTEYLSFIASLKAFSDYFIILGRSYFNQISENNSEEDNEKLALEYIEWTVCNLKHEVLNWFQKLSKLTSKKFYLILSYFIDIYSDNTKENFQSNSYVGDGFQPSITLIDESILFSPLAIRYLLSFNNILYSINKTNKLLFDNDISKELEPVLINQIKYLFSHFNELKCRKNIIYDGGEVDIFILSKNEKVCLSIQVKTTITPDSARTVGRVQDRTIEAFDQISRFEELGIDKQTELINNAFNTKLNDLKIINLIVVRSCAGSDKAWKINNKYRILNYPILAKILCDKISSNDLSFIEFNAQIFKEQENIKNESSWGVEYEKLQISDYEIKFPNIYYDENKIIGQAIKAYKCFPKLEKAE